MTGLVVGEYLSSSDGLQSTLFLINWGKEMISYLCSNKPYKGVLLCL